MNLFELQAVLTLNSSGYTKGLKDAEDEGNGFLGKVQGLTKKVAGAWGTLKTAGQGAKQMLSPVIGIVTDAIEAYGDYEQAVGGVRKLFGSAAKTVTDNAKKAFKTAGLSVNDYMELVIQSGATMLKSVGEDSEEAARLMDLAIIDMADNVNALGNDMTSLMNAYRGFSRGNFTMLDNLALGYAGTEEGMKQLLADAEELSGVHYDIGNYADIVQAIHEIQKAWNIAGTSAAEAATTQQGSKAAMEAAKQNLLVTLADTEATQEEKDAAAKEYADAMVAYVKNLVPVIVEVLKSLIPALGEALKEVGKALGILDAEGNLNLPQWLRDVFDFLGKLFTTIKNAVVDVYYWITGRANERAASEELAAELVEKGMTEEEAAVEADAIIYAAKEKYGQSFFNDNRGDKWKTVLFPSEGEPTAVPETGDVWHRKRKTENGEEESDIILPEGVTENAAKNFTHALATQLEWDVDDLSNATLQKLLVEYADLIKESSYLDTPSEVTVATTGTGVNAKWATIAVDGGTFSLNLSNAANSAWNYEVDEAWGYSGVEGHFAKGLWDVPYDNYLAKLHRDEMVLTASQARQYREGRNGGMNTALMYQTIADAVAAAVGDIQINMDGEAVGNAVASTVSRNIYKKSVSRRYG